MIVCVHEDRPSALVGLQLTVLSLRRHCPGLQVVVSAPGASKPLRDWLALQPGVALQEGPDWSARGWDVKPDLLLRLLAEGHQDVVWIDSDILVTGPLPEALLHADAAACVVTEEPFWDARPQVDRAAAWALQVARQLPWTLNSGVLRVTPHHVRLLQAWRDLLTDPAYRAAQAQPWQQRPRHLMGAQGVLEALLCSREFAHVPVVMLRRGRDIAQCHGPAGFTPAERVRVLTSGRRVPPLLHALGGKPWEESTGGQRVARYVNRLHHELSPYTRAAHSYACEIEEVASWSRPCSRSGRVLSRLAGGHPTLQELPLAVVDASARRARSVLRRSRRSA